MSKLSILDVFKAKSGDAEVGIIENSEVEAPEFSVVPGRDIDGIKYQTKVRTGRPTVAFRKPNDGVDPTKSNLELKDVNCYIMSGRVEADKAVADAYPGGWETYFAEESSATFEAATETFGTQFYYGNINEAENGASADGFPGLQSVVDSSMVYDATGTSAGAANSIYLVRFGPKDVQAVLGMGGMLELGDVRVESITGNNSKQLPGYVADLSAWIGLQNSNKNSVARIYNVTTESGKGCDDDLITKALELFPANRMPTHILMPKRALFQLQRSRTATNSTGRAAPIPTESFDIPIVVTGSLLTTEAIVS